MESPATTRKKRKGDPINVLLWGGNSSEKAATCPRGEQKKELQECTFHIGDA